MKITINYYFIISALLFTIGIFGIFINRKNVINILMCIELLFLSVNLNFISFSLSLNDITGKIFSLFVLTVSAAEIAIGLSIIIIFFRNKNSIAVHDINSMKG